MHFLNVVIPILSLALRDVVHCSSIPSDIDINWCEGIRSANNSASKAIPCRGGQCECSCNKECSTKLTNIQACCATQGLPQKCMHLCTYTTTVEEIGCMASECPLALWSYCAASTYDDTIQKQCCRDKGLPEVCMGFCDKDGMSVSIALDFKYVACIPYTPDILQCFYDNVPDTPRWKTDDRTFEPETLTDHFQIQLANSLKGPRCASRNG